MTKAYGVLWLLDKRASTRLVVDVSRAVAKMLDNREMW